MKTAFFIICSTVASIPLYSSDSFDIPMAEPVVDIYPPSINVEVQSRMTTPHNLFIELKDPTNLEIIALARFCILQEPDYRSHQPVSTLYMIIRHNLYFLADDYTSHCLNRLHLQSDEKTYVVAPVIQEHGKNVLLKFPLQSFKTSQK